eukprot:Em0004g697a
MSLTPSEHIGERKLQHSTTSATATNSMSESDATSMQTVVVETSQMDSSAAGETNNQSSSKVDIKQLFFDAVLTGEWSKVVNALHTLNNSMLLQVIDGGGQPAFQEIFPLLISGPSVALLIFKLTDGLTEEKDVQFQQNDGVLQTWPDRYIVKDFIFHTISGVSSSLKDPNPFGSIIVFVGTHKDELKGSEDTKQSQIRNIAETMHGWLRESKTYKRMQVESIEDFIIGIHSFKKQDIVKVKERIEKFVSDQTASQDIPARYLVFDFVLHSYAKSNKLRIVGKKKCREIANKCGINEVNFKKVLRFLHDEAGTLLYYSDIPKLNNYVITDFQLIFDSITEIIIKVQVEGVINVGGSGRAPIGDMRNDQRRSGKEGGGQDNEFLYVSGDQLGMDDFVDVMEEVIEVASRWLFIGLALRLKSSELDTISSKNHDDPQKCLKDMLVTWLQQCYDTQKTTATTSTSSLVLQDLAEKVIMLRNAGERERRQFTANTSQILSDKLSQSLPAIKCPSDPYDFRYHGCMDPPMLKSNVLPHSHLATPITAPVMEIQQPQTPAHPTFSPIVQQRSEPVQSGSSVFKQPPAPQASKSPLFHRRTWTPGMFFLKMSYKTSTTSHRMLKYQAGLDKLTELALSAIFSEISSFMPAVKILLQLGLT